MILMIRKILLLFFIMLFLFGCTKLIKPNLLLSVDTTNTLSVCELNSATFHNICGSYIGLMKNSSDTNYNSIQIDLYPNSSFEVFKQTLKGDKKCTRVRGNFTISNDTLTLHNIIDNDKFIFKNNEIHYLSDINYVEKGIKNILYKKN